MTRRLKAYIFSNKSSQATIKNLFKELYMDFYEPLCKYAFRYFSDKDEAEDIVQTVMAKLWEQKDKLHEIKNLENYMYRAVHNTCLNKIQQLKVKDNYSDYNQRQLALIELEDFEQTFYQWEIREKLDVEIEKLTPKAKEVFGMRFLENMRYKEISEKLNISERTVESHLQNAVKVLRARLKKYI